MFKDRLNTIVPCLIASALVGVGISFHKVYLFHVFLLIAVVFFIIEFFQKDKSQLLLKPPIWYYSFLFVFLGWSGFSIVWSVDKVSALKYFIILCTGIGLSLVIASCNLIRSNRNKLNRCIPVIIGIEIIVCLLEIFTSFRWPISPYISLSSPFRGVFGREIAYSIYEHGCGSRLASIAYQKYDSIPTGFHWNPNAEAVFMVMVLPFFLYYSNRIIKIAGIILIGIIIYYSGSRGGGIGYGITIIIYIFGLSFKKVLTAIVSISVLGAIIVLCSGLINSDYKNKSNEIRALLSAGLDVGRYIVFDEEDLLSKYEHDGSIVIRARLMKGGLKSIRQHLFLGVGIGGSDRVEAKEKIPFHIKSVHNYWMEIAVDLGLVFLLIYSVWYFAVTIKLFRIACISKDKDVVYLSKSVAVSLLVFVFTSIILSSVIYFLPMWVLIGVALSIIMESKASVTAKDNFYAG